MARGPLEGLRVVDLTDDSGRFATKLLAESGASVVRIGVGHVRTRHARARCGGAGAGCSTGGTTAASSASTLDLAHRRRADAYRGAGGAVPT